MIMVSGAILVGWRYVFVILWTCRPPCLRMTLISYVLDADNGR